MELSKSHSVISAPRLRISASLCVCLVVFCLLPVSALAQDDPAHQQFLFAYKLLQRGDTALAAEAFDEYLGKFPDAPKRGDAMYYRALIHRRAGDNQKAADLLHAAPAPSIVPRYAVDMLLGQVMADLRRYPEALAALERIDTNGLDPQVRASVLYLRGLSYRGADNLAAAERDLAAAADIDSNLRSRALLDLARVQVLADNKDRAVATLTRVFDLPDTAAVAEAARLAGDLAYQQKQYELAVSFYERVANSHQSSKHFGPAVAGLLWSHFSAGHYNSVLNSFEKYRTALPLQDRVAAWYLAGSAHQQLGQHEQAIELFDQIAHGEGDYPLLEKILYKQAVSYFETGKDDKMRLALNRLTQQYPQSPLLVDAAYLQAAADARKGDVAQAAAKLTAMIDQGPSHPYYAESLLHRARLYEKYERYDAAVADYRTYLDAAPNAEGFADAALRLIDLAYRTGKYEQAEQTATQLLGRPNLSPLVAQEVMYRRALTLIKLDKPTDALAQLDKLQRDHPLNPFAADVAYYRGVLLMSEQRDKEAIPLLQEASASDKLATPQRANALRLIAMHERGAGRIDAAFAALDRLEQVVTRNKLTDEELLWLADQSLQRSDTDGAIAYADPVSRGRPGTEPRASAEAFFIIGKSHRAQRQYAQAVKNFDAALAIGSDFDERAQLELARTYRDQGDTDAALQVYAALTSSTASQIAAESLFDSAVIWRDRARDRRRHDDREGLLSANTEARRLLKRIVLLYPFPELSPLPELAYLELAEVAVELGEIDVATQELRTLAESFPNGPYAVYARAVIAADQRKLGDALALLEPLKTQPLDARLKGRVDTLRELLEKQKP